MTTSAADPTPLPVAVVMITLNEEYHLKEAIENVKPWASEIFILDSCSTDRTVDIALDQGVNIAQRRFTNFGDQWNFAIENFPVSAPWTMKLDPDERVTPELVKEMARVCEYRDPCNGYWMHWRLWFMGKPLHVKPSVLRLWKTGKCKFSAVLVNEHPIIDGQVGHLRGLLEHHDSLNLHHWLDKQNRYSTMEAIRIVKGDGLATRPRLLGNGLERRMFMKKHFHRIPLRFSFYWFYLMFANGVWRDGFVGKTWAHLRVELMKMKEFKAIEMRATGRIPEAPRAPHGDYDPRVMSSDLQKKIMLCPDWERN
jgi:glycosyltransferase involved in cell wall biosynthesis